MEPKARRSDSKRAAIILAGGEGKRLADLTQKIAGFQIPKQFCPIIGELPLMEQTRRRVSRSVDWNLISFVLNRDHERFFAPLLTEVAAENLIIQPCNRGTAPAILYSLLRLVEVAPDSSVLLVPSDHYVADEARLMEYVDLAFATIEKRPELTVLLGIVPDEAETAYGWIEPGAELNVAACEIFQVHRFWEKPPPSIARELLAKRCLWNGFMIVGRLSTFLSLFIIAAPRLYLAFRKIRPSLGTCFESQTVGRLYKHLRPADFSRKILESAAINLAVLRVCDTGWTDLGEPDRVIKTISSLGIQQRWAAA
jgi:mannose-1-phosphate guanylyltransferase